MPFFSWDWFYSSWLHFAKPNGQELAVVVVEEPEQGTNRLIGVLPLVSGTRKMPGPSPLTPVYRTLEFCNVGTIPRSTAYFDPQSGSDAVFRAIEDRLFAERDAWDMIEWANIPENMAFHRYCLEAKPSAPSSIIRWQGFVAPSIKLDGSLDAYYDMLGRGTRKDIRRRLRKFKDFGEEKDVRFYTTPDDVEKGLEQLFEVHRRSWKGEFTNPHYPAFYREISKSLSERGELIIAIASLRDRPISAGYILTSGETYYSLINDHDMEFRDLAPGILLFIHELDYMVKNGKRVFDLCGTTYDYKERLAGNRLSHSTFQLFHGGLKSRFLYAAKTRWLPLLRKLLRKNEPEDLISFKKR